MHDVHFRIRQSGSIAAADRARIPVWKVAKAGSISKITQHKLGRTAMVSVPLVADISEHR